MFEKLKKKWDYYFKFHTKCDIDYPGVGRITDDERYAFIKRHSRFIDRINPKRMHAMTNAAFDLMIHLYPGPSKPGWKFFPDFFEQDDKDTTEGCWKF
jgi:hypothetical protein